MIPIKYSLCLGEPFVDYLNISSPKDRLESILSGLRPILDSLGMSEVIQGLYELPDVNGTFKAYIKNKVAVFSASGQVLERMRQAGVYNHYLAVFSQFEHRITMMHLTCDYRIDAPKYLDKLYDKAQKGEVYLSRKAVNPLHVSKLLGRNLDGADTGTVYLGNRKNSDIWAKVYDKRQERIAKGYDDPMPTTRIEIAVQSDVNASLRDASKPRDLFFHIAAKSLVQKPKDCNEWVAHGQPFELPDTTLNLTTHERLTRVCENSFDIGRLFKLAIDDYGDSALDEIQKIIRNRYIKFKNGQVSQ
jgi:hypothetical protein